MPTQTTRVIRNRSWGSGTRLSEMVPIPAFLYYPGRVVGSLRQHPVAAAYGGCTLVLTFLTGSLAMGLLLGAVAFAFGLTWVLRSEQAGTEGAGLSWPELIRVMRKRTRLRKNWALACDAGKVVGPKGNGPPRLPSKITGSSD